MQALVDAPAGTITGQAEITRAIEGPESDIRIHEVVGRIHSLGFGPAVRVVTLEGVYAVSVPPPAIGTYLAHFAATLVVGQDDWTGRGSFVYDRNEVDDVPVKALED